MIQKGRFYEEKIIIFIFFNFKMPLFSKIFVSWGNKGKFFNQHLYSWNDERKFWESSRLDWQSLVSSDLVLYIVCVLQCCSTAPFVVDGP